MQLPQEFLERMKTLLGGEFDDFLKSYEEKSVQGLRVNTEKISVEDFQKLVPFHLEQIPWTENGFYTEETDAVTKHPYYYAGLYYVQEPSAMLPAALLEAEPGDKILDLCAAPGGKATELGSRLHRKGLLVANDISHSRAKALLKNLELNGIGNVFVCSEEPDKLSDIYEDFFDKILVDAPCSGEGMFRRDSSLIKAWLEHGPEYYAEIQKRILDAAVKMLKWGGKMVYSTCTFSPEEDEGIVRYICENHKDMEVIYTEAGETGRRLFPHRVKGEGHFAVILQKRSFETKQLTADTTTRPLTDFHFSKKAADFKEWESFCKESLDMDFDGWKIFELEDRFYALPEHADIKKKIRYLRTGLLLGERKKNRFEPSQALAMFLKAREAKSILSLKCDDDRVKRYLKGETLEVPEAEEQNLKGWTLICVDDYPLGWGKYVNGTMRNKYYPGWRIM
ncbi:MAG: RsmB/NOP family class I SAM-dependent RNA methyltransferase [Eubacteriales bacterium]|nr:RsmB/NOP family class I SAM-dependent RNA methyltransferase [Eubacteriales bacterium]